MSEEPPISDRPPPSAAEPPPSAAEPPRQDDDEESRWRTSLAAPVAIVAIAIGFIGAIIWVARQEQDAAADALAGTAVEGPLPVTVPYRDVGGAIVIDVTFGDDSRTVPMVLDTGAPTIISEDLAAAFAGDAVGTIAGASADGQVVTSDVVRLPQVAIGEAVFRDVGAVVGAIEPGNPFYCLTTSGFVGASLMQAATWHIDPATQMVTIAGASDGLDTAGSLRLDITRSSEVSPSPLFELETGQGSLTFLADTGSDGWLAVHPADLDRLGTEAPVAIPTVSVLGTGSAGAFSTRVGWLAQGLELGDEPVTMPLAVSETLPQGQGNAGTDFLRQFALTVAWDEDALYLEPLTPLAAVAPSVPASVGLGWDDGYVVGSFVEGLEANEGLSLGTPVVAIDGEAVSGMPFDDYCTRVVRASGPDARELTVAGDPPLMVTAAPVEGFFEALP